jgi:hypothetical protein
VGLQAPRPTSLLSPHHRTATPTHPPTVYAFGGVSGAHFNPAVSFMLYLQGEIDLKKLLAYAAAQVRLLVARRVC